MQLFMRCFYQLFLRLCLWLVPAGGALALMPLADTGLLERPGKRAVFLYGHLAYQGAGGLAPSSVNWDVIGRLDQGLDFRKDLNIRYFAGLGYFGLQGGAFLKWVPFPDYKYQPAVGVSGGLGYRMDGIWQSIGLGRRGGENGGLSHFLEVYLNPLASKEFSTAGGVLAPYTALPIVLQVSLAEGMERLGWFVLGARGELFFIHFHEFNLNVELGIGVMGAAPSYLSLGVITKL